MLKLTRLAPSPGTTRGRFSGYCRPGRIAADARAHAEEARNWATASRSADFILVLMLALLALIAYSVITGCTSAREAAQQRHREEHPTPGTGRYDWRWADETE